MDKPCYPLSHTMEKTMLKLTLRVCSKVAVDNRTRKLHVSTTAAIVLGKKGHCKELWFSPE
jgi:hypothetical protein